MRASFASIALICLFFTGCGEPGDPGDPGNPGGNPSLPGGDSGLPDDGSGTFGGGSQQPGGNTGIPGGNAGGPGECPSLPGSDVDFPGFPDMPGFPGDNPGLPGSGDESGGGNFAGVVVVTNDGSEATDPPDGPIAVAVVDGTQKPTSADAYKVLALGDVATFQVSSQTFTIFVADPADPLNREYRQQTVNGAESPCSQMDVSAASSQDLPGGDTRVSLIGNP